MSKAILILFATTLMACGCTTNFPLEEPEPLEEYDRQREARRPMLRGEGHPRDATLATLTLRRQISMYYQIHLNQEFTFARTMASVFEINDSKIRSCYSTRLDSAPSLRGDVAFRFSLQAGLGGLGNITKVGGAITDRPLLTCLHRQLSELAFRSPRALQGVIVYEFDYREQEITRSGRGRILRHPVSPQRR